MELGLTAEQLELKDELRHYFVRLVDEVEGSEGGEPTYTHYIRRMGEDGWLGIWVGPWSTGARPAGPIDQMIFVEESHWAGVPLPLLTLNSVGPDPDGAGHRRAEAPLPPGHPAGRGPLRHRLHRARPGPTSRRCRRGRFATATST